MAQVINYDVVELADNTLQLHLNDAIKDGGLICDKSYQCFNICHNLLQCHKLWQLFVWVRVVLIGLLKSLESFPCTLIISHINFDT